MIISFSLKIVDPLQVYDKINLGRRIDPLWPDELWRSRGGQNYWKDWLPEEGMEGIVSTFNCGLKIGYLLFNLDCA